MKKLSILVALIVCVTIGGVYATWTYAGTEVAPQQDPVINKMGEVTFSGAAGAYHVENNTLAFIVEPKGNTFDAELTTSGSAVIRFTPDATISDAALEDALNATITVVGTDLEAATYGGQKIYTLDDTFKITLDEAKWTKDGNDYTYTLEATALKNAVAIGAFNLPSHDDYVDFQKVQKAAVFRINITAAK